MSPVALVTGGSGFLGNAVILALKNRHPEWTIYNLDLNPRAIFDKVQTIQADISSKESVDAAFEISKPTIVFHVAGVVPNGQARYSAAKSVHERTFNVNVNGTKNILDAARKNGCESFVYTSSCTVISDDLKHDYPLMDETVPTGHASLAYGSSKAAAEKLVLAANGPEMSTCALRPATIIGPGDSYGVISTIHACIRNGETPYIIGDGNNMYDFVYIDNVAHAHVLAVENLLCSKTAAGQAMFISNQEPIYFRDFMLAIWAHFGHKPPFQVYLPAGIAWGFGWLAEWAAYFAGREIALSRGTVQDAVGIRYSNNDKAVRLLGYKPLVGFADAVRLSCDDFARTLEQKKRAEKA